MVHAANGYTCTQPRVCHEAKALVAYTRHELMGTNSTDFCSPEAH